MPEPDKNAELLRLIAADGVDQAGDSVSQTDLELGTNSVGLPDFETVIRAYHKRIYNLSYRLLGILMRQPI